MKQVRISHLSTGKLARFEGISELTLLTIPTPSPEIVLPAFALHPGAVFELQLHDKLRLHVQRDPDQRKTKPTRRSGDTQSCTCVLENPFDLVLDVIVHIDYYKT